MEFGKIMMAFQWHVGRLGIVYTDMMHPPWLYRRLFWRLYWYKGNY